VARVIVVGSVNIDHLIRCSQLPVSGETVIARERSDGFGGKGGNQAAAATRLGAPTWLIAATGADEAGDRAVSDLESSGVRTDHMLRVTGSATGEATVLVGNDGENMIIVVPGANALLSGKDVDHRLRLLRPTVSDVVLVDAEVDEECAEAAAAACARTGAQLIYNLAPARPLRTWASTPRAVLVVNEVEARQVSRTTGTDQALAALGARIDAVVVTRGAAGAVLRQSETLLEFPAPAVSVVDTAGAGDAFCGALAADRAMGQTLAAAVGTAVKAASFAVTAAGARGALATRRDLRS
jgi:ribokinase